MIDVLKNLAEFNYHLLLAFIIAPWIYGGIAAFTLGAIYDQLNFRGKTKQAKRLLKWALIGFGYFYVLCVWALASDNFPRLW